MVNSGGLDTSVYFEYGPTAKYGSSTATQDIGLAGAATAFSASLVAPMHLVPLVYHYRAVAINAKGTSYGVDKTATLPITPGIASTPQASLSATDAELSIAINPYGIATTAYFQYSTDSAFGTFSTTAMQKLGAGRQPVNVFALLGDLAPGQPYYYRLVTVTAGGAVYGTTETFTTLGFQVTSVASTGTPAPGTALDWATLGSGALNAQDGAAFLGTLAGAPAVSKTGIWANVANSGTLSLVAQTGSANFTSLSDPIINDNGTVIFLANAGLGLSIWSDYSGAVQAIGSPGDFLDGSLATFASFSAISLDNANPNSGSDEIYALGKLKDDPIPAPTPPMTRASFTATRQVRTSRRSSAPAIPSAPIFPSNILRKLASLPPRPTSAGSPETFRPTASSFSTLPSRTKRPASCRLPQVLRSRSLRLSMTPRGLAVQPSPPSATPPSTLQATPPSPLR